MPEGLMSRAQNAQQPTSMPAATQQKSGEGEAVSPEDQQAYDDAMQMVGQLIYKNEQISDKLVAMVKQEDPATGIADASAFVLSKIEETFQGEYPEDLIVQTADEISDLIMELVEASGTVPEVTEDIAVKAKGLLTQQLIEAYGVDPQQFEAATQDVSEEDLAEYSKMFGAV